MTLEIYGLRRRTGINRELAESGDLRKKEGEGGMETKIEHGTQSNIAIRVPLGRCIRATLFIQL